MKGPANRPLPPAEQSARIARAARAIQYGTEVQGLEARGFSDAEIRQAQAIARHAARKQRAMVS